MEKVFRRDYGVFCCPHVFSGERPVLFVVRDPDGYWQFFCGQNDEDYSKGHHIGIGHLLERDPTLESMAELKTSTVARRVSVGANWKISNLEVE